MLLANKCDIPGVAPEREKLNRFCEEHGFFAWFATSAQDETNVENAMNALIERIMEVAKDHTNSPTTTEDIISLEDNITYERDEKKKSGCC